MNDFDVDSELRHAARHVAELSRQVTIDLQHKSRLREELLRRHQELSADHTTQRAARSLWPRLTGLKRLTLVAPPALAVALACSVILWALQISGHQRAQAAEAARITTALRQTVPTVTQWQFTVRRNGPDGQGYARCSVPLGPSQRLYMGKDGQAFIYAAGKWWQVSAVPSTRSCPAAFQWAFATLPLRLSQVNFEVLAERRIDGVPSDGLRYGVERAGKKTADVTVWISHATGLVVRMQKSVYRGGRVVERDVADYTYARNA
jgi:hypothetical protein